MTDWSNGGPAFDGLPTAGSAYDERLALLDVIRQVRAEVARLDLSPAVPGVAGLCQERDAVLGLLDGYLVSRLQEGDRPLLAVIGGPTGAGKSTILNSLIGAEVSPASVLRPTTRTPVLLHNPADTPVMMSQRLLLLPGLEVTTLRENRSSTRRDDSTPLNRIRRVARQEVPPGLAVLDSPDLDSWLTSNRDLAAALLNVADLWIFVTTGTDYADAVPWELLDGVTTHGVTVAAVLNRMRPAEVTAVRQHFAQMLIERGLRKTPVFTIPELALVDNVIPYEYVSQLTNWLAQQSGVHDVREAYLDRAVQGTLDQVLDGVRRLADAAEAQGDTERRLRADIRAVFSHGREELHRQIRAGAVASGLRDAWRGVVESHQAGRLRRRLNAALRPAESPYAAVGNALRLSVTTIAERRVTLVRKQVAERWQGRDGTPGVDPVTADGLIGNFPAHVDAVVVAWLTALEERLRLRSERPGMWSRWSPETLAVATLALSLPTGDMEGPAEAAQRSLAERNALAAAAETGTARQDLLASLDQLLTEEESRVTGFLDQARVGPTDSASLLRDHVESLERLKRTAFGD